MISKTKFLLFPCMFEFYYVGGIFAYFIRNGSPATYFWFITLALKVALGYLIYRLYVAKRGKTIIAAALLMIGIILFTLVVFFINPDFSTKIGGPDIVLATANTALLISYVKNNQRIVTRLDHSIGFKKQFNNLAVLLLVAFSAWVIIEMLIGKQHWYRQMGMAVFWIYYNALVQKFVSRDESDRN